ncbi:MAG: carboxypeptidase regulatory-like domain-containing protein [Gemmatimonadaceae bacterium]
MTQQKQVRRNVRCFAFEFITAVAIIVECSPRDVAAQSLRGAVVDRLGQPLPGVVVMLLDSTLTAVNQALTNERGEYRVLAPASGTYRMRTLRIGYQPVLSKPVALAVGTTVSERIVLESVRVLLPTVRVTENRVCGRQAAAESATMLAVWEQAMASVQAADLVSTSRGLTATTMQLDRRLDARGGRVREQLANVRTDYVREPWKAVSADSLRHQGYVWSDSSGASSTYNAPGLKSLLSPFFLEDHCISLAVARDTGELGIAFEPTPARRKLSEIRGTLWLARATAALQRMEFTFTNTPGSAIANARAGGTMNFARLADGSIVVTAWDIRMPVFVHDAPPSLAMHVAELASTGGQLVLVQHGTDTVYRSRPLTISGTVRDSLSGVPIARARVQLAGVPGESFSDERGRFRLDAVMPGEYALRVRTASLDSIRSVSQLSVDIVDSLTELNIKIPTGAQLASALCGTSLNGGAGRGKGGILGDVQTGRDSTNSGNIRVIAEWTDVVISPTSSIQRNLRRMETRTAANGAFRLCGVPTEATLSVRALPVKGRSELVSVRLAAEQRFASIALHVDLAVDATATFVGRIFADSSLQPIDGVQVTVPVLGLSTRTDTRGQFRLPNIPPGTYEVIARRVGFGVLTTSLDFAANEEEVRRMFLHPLSLLDTLNTTATQLDLGMKYFDENRRVGLGKFLTRDELAAMENRSLAAVFFQMSAVKVVSGVGGNAWIASARGGRHQLLNVSDRKMGAKPACYAQVYVDNLLVYGGRPEETLFNLNSLSADRIEALEYYASPAETPARYSGLGATCGVVVIWSRR